MFITLKFDAMEKHNADGKLKLIYCDEQPEQVVTRNNQTAT